jgi:hypothetical protein
MAPMTVPKKMPETSCRHPIIHSRNVSLSSGRRATAPDSLVNWPSIWLLAIAPMRSHSIDRPTRPMTKGTSWIPPNSNGMLNVKRSDSATVGSLPMQPMKAPSAADSAPLIGDSCTKTTITTSDISVSPSSSRGPKAMASAASGAVTMMRIRSLEVSETIEV